MSFFPSPHQPPHELVQGFLHVFIPESIDDGVPQRGHCGEEHRHHLVLQEAGGWTGIDEDAVSQEACDDGEECCTGG